MPNVAENGTEVVPAIAPVLDAVAGRAHFVAALVALARRDLRQGGDRRSKRTVLPAPCWLSARTWCGDALLLWENAGLTVHIEAGLPGADAAAKELGRRAKLGASEFTNVTDLDLWRKVNVIWTAHFAWRSEEIFGAEITLAQIDDNVLVDALAEFVWQNRNVFGRQTGGHHDEATC